MPDRPDPFALADVIPGRLAWAADGLGIDASDPRASYFRLETWKIDVQAFNCGAFRVMHYDRKVLGNAFGPLSLVQAVVFSEELAVALGRNSAVLVRHKATTEDHANTAVLLGCYLITREGWTVHELVQALPVEAGIRFPCQWDRTCRKQEPVMTVQDCWAGVQLAKELGWLHSGPAASAHLPLSISQQLRMLAEYDAAWMVPDRVLAMADPMTTIRDPNPATCSRFSGRPHTEESLWDMEPPTAQRRDTSHQRQVTQETCDTSDLESDALSTGELVPPCAGYARKVSVENVESTSTAPNIDGPQQRLLVYPGERPEDRTSTDSVASVCKRDNRDEQISTMARSGVDIPDFVTFCRKNRIATVVRTNSGQEEGLVEDGGSYHPAELRRHGIRHVDLFVNDTRGSLPRVDVIQQFLDCAKHMGLIDKDDAQSASDESPVLLVHCKSGFGRSVLLACCLMVFQYDVPGRALLGWARLVRPGAITVREQEVFLCDLGGREDLQRMLDEGRSSSEVRCDSWCAVQ